MRSFLKIPSVQTNRKQWTEAEIAMLGTMPDEETARRLGISVSRVRSARERHRILIARGTTS